MTLDVAGNFGGFEGRAWLNCAHQGPLPLVAVAAAERALADKLAPHRLGDEAFAEVPARLKDALGRLAGVPPEEAILGN
ncbi:MAG TPA: aminotransferase class V-fold PLP-dependent enzyme, partial [Actinomycetes bacterium]|nr:aminotransferase class V-fold PLP-dependent enzyme [Actinomycetes bacterium]